MELKEGKIYELKENNNNLLYRINRGKLEHLYKGDQFWVGCDMEYNRFVQAVFIEVPQYVSMQEALEAYANDKKISYTVDGSEIFVHLNFGTFIITPRIITGGKWRILDDNI